ncbi:MAG: hypothetical protein C4534_02045 [Gaiellales bacterium]|nr:MAG: hypothetical protein C4534_02045 [Gaiellales bacterium]
METKVSKAPETKDEAYTVFDRWIRRRPGLDWRDKAGIAAYNSEVRAIGKQRIRALKALQDFARPWNEYSPELLIEASQRAYSGRLSFDHKGQIEYTAGQYWPTEYRQAAAAVLELYCSLVYAKRAKEEPRTYQYNSMADVKRANHESGGFWFEPATMRYFQTKIETSLIAGRYFVTSERHEDEPRRYTCREALPDGSIESVGQFQQYRTLKEAREAIAGLLRS